MQGMKYRAVATAIVLLMLSGVSLAADSAKGGEIKRPPIVGVAWIGLRTADLDATRKFYSGDLGLEEIAGIKNSENGLTRSVFQINSRQFVQVLPELTDPKQNRLIEIAFETTNAERLRAYLASKGVEVPEKIEPMAEGTRGFAISDADNHVVKFVQFMEKPSAKGAQPDGRVSTHMIHAGFIVHHRAEEDRLFKDLLGFSETWHGGMTDDKVSWIDMRVPDGKDWLEYMMDYEDSDVRISGIMNHLALGVASVKDSYDEVVKRGMDPEKPKIGRDGKWQLNLYTPDQTRVELMEPKPVQTPCCSPMRQ